MKKIQKKSKSYYSIFLCCVIAIIICLSGYQLLKLTKKDSNKKTKTVAEIIETREINDGNYEFKLIYYINKTKYTSSIITKNKKSVGDIIDIFYDNDDPTIITDKSNQSIFYMGNIIILCGCCICLFVLIALFSKPDKSEKESNIIQHDIKFPHYVPVFN